MSSSATGGCHISKLWWALYWYGKFVWYLMSWVSIECTSVMKRCYRSWPADSVVLGKYMHNVSLTVSVCICFADSGCFCFTNIRKCGQMASNMYIPFSLMQWYLTVAACVFLFGCYYRGLLTVVYICNCFYVFVSFSDVCRHFHIYLLSNWIDLDETWQIGSGSGKSNPVESSA